MTDEELSVSDATLIARLRAANAYKGPDFNTPIADPIKVAAADRVEELVATNEALADSVTNISHLWSKTDSEKQYLASRAEQLAATNERLEAALRKIAGECGCSIALAALKGTLVDLEQDHFD